MIKTFAGATVPAAVIIAERPAKLTGRIKAAL